MSVTPQLIDSLWVLVCAGLVCLMQAGFLCLESGLTRSKNAINVALKNLTDFSVSLLLFWAFGFALMFGVSSGGWFGTTDFFLSLESSNSDRTVYFLFQAMFCATAATIVSGAVSGRMRFSTYIVVATIVSGLIYPLFGHWAWGITDHASGWLASLGFVDFAGSTVVHSVGGWVALAAVMTIGPRAGRFENNATANMSGSNIPMAMLGVVLLWTGWIGFNGGSTLALNDQVPGIIGKTFLAGAAGMLTGLLIGAIRYGHANVGLAINGSLAGLVAITASCHAVTAESAVLIGAVGAIAMWGTERLLIRHRIDDAIGAVPVHTGAGTWGTLAVAIFGNQQILGTQLSFWQQLGVQALGVGVAFVFAFVTTKVTLRILSRFVSLRVSSADEQLGLNIAEHGASTETMDLIIEMEGQLQSGDYSSKVTVEPASELAPVALQYNRVIDELSRETDRAIELADEAEARRHEAESAMNAQSAQALELANTNTELEAEMVESARLQQELLAASRHAGMAEVATGTLHNVGNVLNSINVSTDLLDERLSGSRTENLKKGVALFAEHQEDLADFLTNDARGKLLPGYVGQVADALEGDRDFMQQELKDLKQNLMHVKEIINVQQTQARRGGSTESTDLHELVESAIKISAAGLTKHDVNLIRDFDQVPQAETDKHKILQVLINLITNAKNAIVEYDGPNRNLTVQMKLIEDDYCQISVIDTGCGIADENLDKLFVHGFTTRDEGHGFGLHSCALAVEEVGGRLVADSDGPGTGATFRVEFPMKPPNQMSDSFAANESIPEHNLVAAGTDYDS